MPPAQWALEYDRPLIQVVLSLPIGQDLVRRLVADTGAGTRKSVFQLILAEMDCLQCGGIFMGQVQLGGAYSGWCPVYLVEVRISQFNFNEPVPVVGALQRISRSGFPARPEPPKLNESGQGTSAWKGRPTIALQSPLSAFLRCPKDSTGLPVSGSSTGFTTGTLANRVFLNSICFPYRESWP